MAAPTASSPPEAAPSPTPHSTADDPDALHELARATALALGSSPAVRNEVRRILTDSRFTAEHKVHFQDLLAEQAASPPGHAKLLHAMAAETARTPDEILALAQSAGDLEAYLPVAEHRATWAGGRDMLVATLRYDETEAPRGYGLDGEPVSLTAEAPPEAPVLVLVPVETDFSEEAQLDAGIANRGAADVIGTYDIAAPAQFGGALSEACPEEGCGGSGGGGGSGPPPGLYYTAADLDYVGEAWARGNPEIEIHVEITYENLNGGTTVYDVRCQAGQYSDRFSGLSRFDQNNESWSGNALVVTKDELEDFGAYSTAGRGIQVFLWEDDTDACRIKTEKPGDSYNERLGGAGASAVLGVFATASGEPGWGLFTIVASAIAVSGDILTVQSGGGDDPLGRIDYSGGSGSFPLVSGNGSVTLSLVE